MSCSRDNREMINIVAPNIKNGGGLELLEYLLEVLEAEYDLNVTVYLDKTNTHINKTNKRSVVFLGSVIRKVILFYIKIDNALYFGNLPPLRKSNNSIVYVHNPYIVMSLSSLFSCKLILCVKYFFQQMYITKFMKNVDIVACQNTLIKEKLYKRYQFSNIELLPFFRLCNKKDSIPEKTYDFCYVSLAHPHKNHKLLLGALKILTEKKIHCRVALTIEENNNDLLREIEIINKLGVVYICNFGMISKREVCDLYSISKSLIFPSLEETFGLALIEAANMNLDIIAPNLEYVFQAVQPSMIYNSKSASSCAVAMERYLSGIDVKESTAVIENKVNKLIQYYSVK